MNCCFKDCKKKLNITSTNCNYCKLYFCNIHRYEDAHNCENYDKMKNFKRDLLRSKLESVKIYKISQI